MRIKNYGMPIDDYGNNGDLFIQYKVIFPSSINSKVQGEMLILVINWKV